MTRGKDQLASCAGQAIPFSVWLTEAEGKLEEGGVVPRSRERLFSKIEELDVRWRMGIIPNFVCH